MKKITLGGMQASDIVLGCMRISDMAVSRVQELLETAVEEGINYFDHADLYGHGASEEVFAKAMGQSPRCGSGFISSPNAASGMTGAFSGMIFPRAIF